MSTASFDDFRDGCCERILTCLVREGEWNDASEDFEDQIDL